MPFVRFIYGWHGVGALERCVVGIWCAVVLGEGWNSGTAVPILPPDGGVCFRHSLRWGLCLQYSPKTEDCARPAGCAFPTPLPRGPLRNNGKKLKRATRGPLVFLHPSLAYKSKLLTLGTVTKKALKRCLRAFFRCCAVRGGFEPPVRLPVRQFSKLVVSATHPSHLSAQWVICLHKRFGTAKIC